MLATVPVDSSNLVLPSGLAEAVAADGPRADDQSQPLSRALATLRSSKLVGTTIPVEYGGQGLDAAEANRRIRSLARVNGSLAIILFQHLAVSSRIAEWGTDDQRRRYLPRLAQGQMLAASAWSEAGAGAAKQHLTTTATEQPDGGWIINGAKTFTTGAGLADVYLVLAQSDDPGVKTSSYGSAGQSFLLVDAQSPGLRTDTGLDLIGMRCSATGFVQLQQCVVPRDALLGPRGKAPRVIASVRASGVTLGAVSAGLADRAYEIGKNHVSRRGLTDNPMAQIRLVELKAEASTASAIVELSGAQPGSEEGVITLLSKVIASRASERACEIARQLLGSAGYGRTHEINLVARDAQAIALMGPTNDLSRDLVVGIWKETE